MKKLKVAALYTGFWLIFAVCFAGMFAMLVLCFTGIPFGIMTAVLGVAVLIFKADFVLTRLAPELMLFGGLCCAFLTAFLGALAIKLGFVVSRYFVKIKRRCDSLRGW